MNQTMETEHILLLTGATGMVGGFLVRWFLERGTLCQIILSARDAARATRIFSDLTELEHLPVAIDSITHCACVIRLVQMVTHPVETADSVVMNKKIFWNWQGAQK